MTMLSFDEWAREKRNYMLEHFLPLVRARFLLIDSLSAPRRCGVRKQG